MYFHAKASLEDLSKRKVCFDLNKYKVSTHFEILYNILKSYLRCPELYKTDIPNGAGALWISSVPKKPEDYHY